MASACTGIVVAPMWTTSLPPPLPPPPRPPPIEEINGRGGDQEEEEEAATGIRVSKRVYPNPSGERRRWRRIDNGERGRIGFPFSRAFVRGRFLSTGARDLGKGMMLSDYECSGSRRVERDTREVGLIKEIMGRARRLSGPRRKI